VRWFSTPAFLAYVGGVHDRGEGANVLEGARTVEVWERTAEEGGRARFSGGRARLGGARTAWGAVHGRGHTRLGGARTAGGSQGSREWG
jgi:hypothetical protein